MSKPILQWAGRKDYLATYIDKHISDLQNKNLLNKNFNYHEPFLGSASVFLHLKSTGKVNKAYLNDNLNQAYLTVDLATRILRQERRQRLALQARLLPGSPLIN